MASYLRRTRTEAAGVPALVAEFEKAVAAVEPLAQKFLCDQAVDGAHAEPRAGFQAAAAQFKPDAKAMLAALAKLPAAEDGDAAAALKKKTENAAPTAEKTRDLTKQADHIYKVAERFIEVCEKSLDARASDLWITKEVNRARKSLEEARRALVEGLRQVRYFHRQAAWLIERFPEGQLVDVLGLVKLVDKAEIEKNDWSLTPGRYVGVAPEEVDEDFDFEETMRDLHIELEGLNDEAAKLARTIAKNFEELIV